MVVCLSVCLCVCEVISEILSRRNLRNRKNMFNDKVASYYYCRARERGREGGREAVGVRAKHPNGARAPKNI